MKTTMRKTFKQLLCGVLSLVLLLSVMPVFPASAADVLEVTETTFSDGLGANWTNQIGAWTHNDDGTITAPSEAANLHYLSRSTSYEMTDYTFQADVTLPAVFSEKTQWGGLAFGIMDGSKAGVTSRYEFTISYVPATDEVGAGWSTRVYKRVTGTTDDAAYVVAGSGVKVDERIVGNTDPAVETTFTMKVVVSGLSVKCYVDDVLLHHIRISKETDANVARGAITGGVGLNSFSNTAAVFSNVTLSGKKVGLAAGLWESDGTWTYDPINEKMTAPKSAGNTLIGNKADSYELSDYVFQTDIVLPENTSLNTQLGGITFGVQDQAGVTSRYEFTVSQSAKGWCPRLYKRSNAEGYAGYFCVGSHTTVNSNVSITEGVPFTMKVVLNGLTAACYIDDVPVFCFTVTSATDAALAEGKIKGGVGLMGFANVNAVFSNTKLYKQEYSGYTQNFDALGDDANTQMMNEGWMGSGAWGGNMASFPVSANIASVTSEGKLQVNATRMVGLRNYQNAYFPDALTMSNYTFEAEVSVPEVEGLTNYNFLGIGFGTKAKSTSSMAGYEFSVHPQIDASGNEKWAARIYNRYAGAMVVAETTLKNVDLALGEAFTMKVILDGATAYCYINDTLIFHVTEANTIVGFPALMSANSGTATVVFDDVKLAPSNGIIYEENFDNLTVSATPATIQKEMDELNSAWFADAADANGIPGMVAKFRPLRVGSEGTNGFVQTYHSAYSYLFDTENYNSGYEFEIDVTYSGIGIDGLQTTATNADFFGVYFGQNANAAGNLGGYEFMLHYDENAGWRARLYNRAESGLIPAGNYVALPDSIIDKITSHEAINFKVALYGATAYCFLDDICVITHTREDGVAIAGDIGFTAQSNAAATDDRTITEVRTLVNFDNFKFMSKAQSAPEYVDVLENSAITLHGVSYNKTEQIFNRMDLTAAEQIAGTTEFSKTSVYSHAREAAGGRIRFNTNSSYITVRATVDYKDTTYAAAMGNGQFGFDVYVDTADGSTYVGTAAPMIKPTEAGKLTFEAAIALGETASRDLTIYFPLTIEVNDVQIGVAYDAEIAKHSIPYADEHIVYYGSSITQGGSVTKSGNSYVNIVGRELNVDYTDLGVWGSANGQQAFAEYIAGLDTMTMFVMDYDHNKNSVADLESTHYSFYETVRAAHPNMPIVMISRPGNAIGLAEDSTVSAYDMKEVIIASYNKAKAAGDENVHFIDGEQFFGYSTEYLPDGVHPNNAGHAAMAEVIGDAMTRILSGEKNVYIGEAAAVSVESWNVALGDNVGVNFYLNISEQAQNAKILVTFDGNTVEYTVDQLTATNNGYKVSVEMAAAQVTKEVGIQAVLDEQIIADETYTVEKYANYILGDQTGKYDDVTKALVLELLNYCDKAQTYFEYNTENRVAADLSNAGKADVSGEGVADMSVSGAVSGVNFYGASMVFESKNAVRFYFTGDMTDVTIICNNENLKIAEKNSMYYVEIADINPDALDDVITITVQNGDQVLTVSYSPMNYIVRMSQKGSDNLKALLKALYNYHLVATEYVQK